MQSMKQSYFRGLNKYIQSSFSRMQIAHVIPVLVFFKKG